MRGVARNMAVSIGLVGVGAFGEFCLKAFHDMPEVKILGVVDVDFARAQQMANLYQAEAYATLDNLLQNPEVQIVALNTPPYLHAEQGLAVLNAGKHLFCEKPLALTLEDGHALMQAAERNQVLLTVDYVMRRNPFWQAAADMARAGVLGALCHMDLANHAAGLSLPDDHWFWDKSKSGGIWIEHGVHFFDAFAWVAGTRGEIVAATAYTRPNGATDRVEALAKFGDTAAHFYHGFDQRGQTEQTTVRLTFEQGYVTLREWVPTSIEIITPVYPDKLRPYLSGTIETSSHTHERFFIRAYAPEGKSAIYRASIQAGLRNLALSIQDKTHKLAVTGYEGLESLRLAVAAEKP